jgi:predicted DNA repair protein MutK
MTYLAGGAYGLFLSVVIPNIELAMALVPVLLIPLMVMGGFFINVNSIPV